MVISLYRWILFYALSVSPPTIGFIIISSSSSIKNKIKWNLLDKASSSSSDEELNGIPQKKMNELANNLDEGYDFDEDLLDIDDDDDIMDDDLLMSLLLKLEEAQSEEE